MWVFFYNWGQRYSSKSTTKIGLSVDKYSPQQSCKTITAIVDVFYYGCNSMAAIVDGIYYGCKTKYVEKCVKHGIKIISITYF